MRRRRRRRAGDRAAAGGQQHRERGRQTRDASNVPFSHHGSLSFGRISCFHPDLIGPPQTVLPVPDAIGRSAGMSAGPMMSCYSIGRISCQRMSVIFHEIEKICSYIRAGLRNKVRDGRRLMGRVQALWRAAARAPGTLVRENLAAPPHSLSAV